MWLRYTVSIALASSCVLACGQSPAGTVRQPCVENDECASGLCEAGQCAPIEVPDDAAESGNDDGNDLDDVIRSDVRSDDSNDTDDDSGGPDASTDGGGPADIGDDAPAQFGEDCENDADCESGICIDAGQGDVCTSQCVDECPDPEWDCRLLSGSGGDVIQICVPPAQVLCTECTTNRDCGDGANLCVVLLDGSFCGNACDTNDDCQDGYGCTAASSGGVNSLQCLPLLGVCSGCFDEDNDLHGIGATCLGSDCNDANTAVYAGASEICDGLDNNCNGTIDEGFNLATDVRHCGECGNLCELPNAVPECRDSACAVASCVAPFDNCNGADADGCETNTDDALNHCGACDNTCAVVEGVPDCTDGTCGIAECNTGFDDCDGSYRTGCEADILNSPDTCGTCDNTCVDPANGVAACVRGACAVGTCLGDTLDCNGNFDDGCEADRFSVDTCLTCGNACSFANAIPSCGAGGCGIASCVPGFVNLDGLLANGCEYDCAPSNGGVEICDGIDNDCDGVADEPGTTGAPVWYADLDGDTWGDTATQVRACNAPVGYVSRGGDCNDLNEDINPGATEICNSIDDNCIGGIDEGLSFDVDGDGFYAIGSCRSPATDCDDNDRFNFPGNVEQCDGGDNNCDGLVDPVNSVGCQNYWIDADNDTYGAGSPLCLCAAAGERRATQAGDCFDGNANARPGQTSWFASNRGDGSYDYDCNGNQDLRYTSAAGACEITLDICSSPVEGWTGGTPSCGNSGNWAVGCQFDFDLFGGSVGCRRSSVTSRQQQCR